MTASKTRWLYHTPFYNNRFQPGCCRYRITHSQVAELQVHEVMLPECNIAHCHSYPSYHTSVRCNSEYWLVEVNLFFYSRQVLSINSVVHRQSFGGRNKYFPTWCKNPTTRGYP